MTFDEIFGSAKWVSAGTRCKTPYFRDVFTVESCASAEITVCGLEFYYLYINGKIATDDLFIKLYTDFCNWNETEKYNNITMKVLNIFLVVIYYIKTSPKPIKAWAMFLL